MKDTVLNDFVQEIIDKEIDNAEFKRYVDIFSRFMGYINLDFKYNATYLAQYTSEFQQINQMLNKKNKKYCKIFEALIRLGLTFELLVDQSFFAALLSKSKSKQGYVAINKSKITSPKIEVRVKMESKSREYVFSKEYDNFEISDLEETICDDVKKFVELKNIGRTNHEAS